MIKCNDAIIKVMKEGNIISAKEIIKLIYSKYPKRPWKESTIRTYLVGCSVNNPLAYIDYPSFPKFLFNHKERRYELYDPQKHDRWSQGCQEDKLNTENKEAYIETFKVNFSFEDLE